MEKSWFEMSDLIRRDYEKSVWIPLLSQQVLNKRGEMGYDGYEEEYFGAVAVMFPEDKSKDALKYSWSDISIGHDNRPYADEESYVEAGSFGYWNNGLEGKYLILQQFFDYSDEITVWHICQDLVLALGLWRKDDVWLLPKENCLEVARLKRNAEGRPVRLEMRAEHLKDYLCARKQGILLSRFHSRKIMTEKDNAIGWKEGFSQTENKDNYRWEGRCNAIHAGNCSPYGSKMAVFHIGRTDVDFDEDVPTYEFPDDDNVKSEHKTVNFKGRKLYSISGELWKTDWISPAQKSPRVRGDKIKSEIPFVIDNEGNTMCADELENSGRYLWFSPTLVQNILGYPKAILRWYTEDTGALGLQGRDVHFGVNSEGLINVYAKDIALLPENDKKIWVAHNVSSEGKVSKELLQSQQEAEPADTTAPEILLLYNMKHLDKVVEDFWGEKMFLEHEEANEIQKKIHRFQAVDWSGVCILSKELTRFVIERLNHDLLKSLTRSLDSKTGSMKRLEQVLYDNSLKGRELMAPLVGIYDLRKADAHLPANDYKDAIELIDIGNVGNNLLIGKSIIDKIAERIYIIADQLERRKEKKKCHGNDPSSSRYPNNR
ncbi:MAG: hypothetical protein JW804_07490 [Sedimentisphaerales bacterium]|nr:hypothetical protein [Sedimentisphaerales bacterium]